MKKTFTLLLLLVAVLTANFSFAGSPVIKSLETPYTISYVREADINGERLIVASGYDGELVCLDYEGNIKWTNTLTGYFNHDVCCYDIDEDGSDEILVASADGSLYCIESDGTEVWSFKKNDIPMYSVAAMKSGDKVVIACGGFDKNLYFLEPDSHDLLHTIASTEYAIVSAWGAHNKHTNQHSINFLRILQDENGKDLLAVHGAVSCMAGSGSLYVMDVDITNKKYKVLAKFSDQTAPDYALGDAPVANLVINRNNVGANSILVNNSGAGTNIGFTDLNYSASPATCKNYNISRDAAKQYSGKFDSFGYRACQTECIKGLKEGSDYSYLAMIGTSFIVLKPDLTYSKSDIINGSFAYNDMYVDHDNMKMVLASTQSGGNCIHVVDLTQSQWMLALENLTPPGNMTEILKSSAQVREGLNRFVQPSWEGVRPVLYMMSDNWANPEVKERIGKYSSIEFLATNWYNNVQDPASWNRDKLPNATYSKTRDGRMQYVLTEQESYDQLLAYYPGKPGFDSEGVKNYPLDGGASYWGGHGNDPFFFSPALWDRLLTEVKGRKTILAFPEMPSNPDKDFEFVVDTLFMPIVNKTKYEGHDVHIYVRNKDIFWLSGVYNKAWDCINSGEYADAFIPSMEETTCRTMDISIAARVGVWTSGCVTSWGSRNARDNATQDRLRQISHQMLPNHFLRNSVYHASLGAQYYDNFEVDQEYFSLFWDMIGKGLVFVPKPEEIISISPVNLAMTPCDEFNEKGEENKWTVDLKPTTDNSTNPFIFDRIRSGWVGAAVTDWDYSRYAAGVIDRRVSFLPPFANGMVLISPGVESTEFRKKLSENLHPLYRDIMTTYKIDGKDYFVDGVKQSASSYYKVVEKEIQESAKKLPLTVEGGEVAWVAAHSGPKHIRLTLIDGGYINPDDATTTIKFHTVDPVSITDLVSGEVFFVSNQKELQISVPTGMFRFLDIELTEDLIK